jgi:hypothetical protein
MVFWKIGFIDHLEFVTTNNYKNIVDFHNLQITSAQAKFFQSAVVLLDVS